jgi:hypothetical protein
MPLHTVPDEVYAKIRLINRAYLANLHLGTKGAEWKVSERFVAGDADAVITPLRSLSEFSAESLPALLNAHERLLKMARQVTGKVHNSFISKYLHFHCSEVVPIFDNYAYDAIWKLAHPPKSEYARYGGRVNQEYGYYCGAMLKVTRLLREDGVESPRLKLLDVLLYPENR